jgi:Asp-tRNA(Asn)/Glu-tRNA(Gln) amidotransferase A subunit family amidase
VRYRPLLRAALEVGMCIPAALYLRAQRIRRQARRELEPLLESFDAVLMPAARGVAPDLTTTGDPSFSAPWSGIGAPQIALPSGVAAGLPLAIQLIGAPGTETQLLTTADWVETVIGFGDSPADPASAEKRHANR